MKIVLIGAGSVQFGYGMLGDIFNSSVLKGCEVTLLDINQKALDSVLENTQKFIKEHSLTNKVTATTDRRLALKNADYIISSIEVGNRFELWDQDWKVPLQYGINQVYGENGGPGGVFHSLRIIPVILEIMKDVMEICPNAYVFNFSNPMTAICTAVHRVYPEAKFIGMCHEIGWLNKWLPPMLDKNIDDLHFRAAGLNHFSCMIELTDRKTGKDLYPEVLEKANAFFEKEPGYSDIYDEYLATGKLQSEEKFSKEISRKESNYTWADRHIARLMLKNYNLLPITVDSHFGEYLGWAWDIVDHRGILDFYDYYRTILSKHVFSEIKMETTERVIPIIDGIESNSGYEEAAVNVPNNGLIEDLPSWVVIEVPAIINKDGVNGIKFDNIPKGYLALLRAYSSVYDLTAEAIIHKSKKYVIQALLANPVVNKASKLDELVDRMITIQNKWLGYLN
ncbi:MAG: alpha-glucosidase [Pleomorphochaeta sp.]